jgi:hypothetical protein
MHFLKKIFFWICLIISFILLIYTFYKSEIYYNGSRRSYYLTYYLISILLIFFSIFSFFLNYKFKEYLIIAVISLVVGLYFFEAYLSFYHIDKHLLKKVKIYENQTKKKYDTRTKFQVYKDLKKNDNDIKVALFAQYHLDQSYELYPLSGISNSKTIHCNENGYYSIYQSDRYGFSNPNSEWDSKNIEYLLVGDSFTHGACVDRPNDIASNLRLLSNQSVLNLGYTGNGPLIQYATLREYLNQNVKKVLWIYYDGNDLQDLYREINDKKLKKYLNNINFSQKLRLKQNEIDDLGNKIIDSKLKIKKKIKKKEFLKLTNLRKEINFYLPKNLRPPNNNYPTSNISELKKILKMTKELTLKNNSKLYFVFLPEYKNLKSNNDGKFYKSIKEIVHELDIPFIDIYEDVFKKEDNALNLFPFELPGHYNIIGYEKTAKSIYKLTRN